MHPWNKEGQKWAIYVDIPLCWLFTCGLSLKPTIFCFVLWGWGWNSEKSISQIPSHLSFCWFLAGGDSGGRLKHRSKGEKGLGCFQLLYAFLLWPAIALFCSFFRNFWQSFTVVPASFQVSVILCVFCSPHPASFVFYFIYYFWLCWVFAASRGLSLDAV